MWMDGCIGWECEGPKRGRRRGRRRCAKHQTFREHRWQLNRVSMFRAFPQLELESDRQSEGREPGFTWRPPGLSHSIHVPSCSHQFCIAGAPFYRNLQSIFHCLALFSIRFQPVEKLSTMRTPPRTTATHKVLISCRRGEMLQTPSRIAQTNPHIMAGAAPIG